MQDPVETVATSPQPSATPNTPTQPEHIAPARDSATGQLPRWLRYVADSRHAVSILLIVGVALYLVNLGGYPLYTKGEPREAVTVFDIVHGGGVILPQRAGVEIPSKPLLMHWLAAIISFAVGGVNEFAVRLPSAALAIAGVLVCYFYVRRLFDDVVAFFAALMMATTFQYLQAATGARVDMTLTFFMEVAFFEFILMAEGITQRWILLYVAIALAVLTKGPIGLILPGFVALVWIAFERRWDVLRRMKLWRGAIIVLVLAGGWYVAALIEGGPGFFRKQILAENLLRFAGTADFHEGHLHPFYYMEFALLAGFMPWTILFPLVGVEARSNPIAIDSRLKYVLIWFATVLIFYNFPQSKRGVYLLCLYPALATLVAIYVRAAIVRPDLTRGVVRVISRLSGCGLLAAGAAGLCSLAMIAARPEALRSLLRLLNIRAPSFVQVLSTAVSEKALLAALFPLAAIALGSALIGGRARLERIVIGVAAGMIFIALEVNLVVVPAIANTLSLRDFTDHAMKIVDGSPVGYLGALNYDVAFYSRRRIPIVSLKDPNVPEYLIAWRSIFDALPQAQRNRFEVVMISNPTSLDGGDQMVLVHERGANPGTPSRPGGAYIEAGYIERMPAAGKLRIYDSVARRSSPAAAAIRGSTSAEPPRRLMSQIRVISDS
ncbi:MAG TPA: glycosyltransferase family 39 protein [Candidatus Acidoferrales bacterium]|nr:glycosyltransferase family 39 protein [Candidatus Acidoferrales bacterium]